MVWFLLTKFKFPTIIFCSLKRPWNQDFKTYTSNKSLFGFYIHFHLNFWKISNLIYKWSLSMLNTTVSHKLFLSRLVTSLPESSFTTLIHNYDEKLSCCSFPSRQRIHPKKEFSVVRLLPKQRLNRWDIRDESDLRLTLTNIKPDIATASSCHRGVVMKYSFFCTVK